MNIITIFTCSSYRIVYQCDTPNQCSVNLLFCIKCRALKIEKDMFITGENAWYWTQRKHYIHQTHAGFQKYNNPIYPLGLRINKHYRQNNQSQNGNEIDQISSSTHLFLCYRQEASCKHTQTECRNNMTSGKKKIKIILLLHYSE